MVLRFIKSNWFLLAILLLIVLAVFRKNLRFTSDGARPVQPAASQEKYTDQLAGATAGKQLGLFEAGAEAAPVAERTEADAERFLRRFSNTAMAEHKKFGIPASVILAHACVSSRAGLLEPAKSANNLMGLTCANGWDGPSVTFDGQCYRKYNTPWESFRDFSIYLAAQDWPAGLRQKSGMEWKAWVNAFDKHHLGTVAAYDKEMEKMILAFRLYELDK